MLCKPNDSHFSGACSPIPYEGFDTTMGQRVRLVRTTRSKLLMLPIIAPVECKVDTKHRTAAETLLLPCPLRAESSSVSVKRHQIHKQSSSATTPNFKMDINT